MNEVLDLFPRGALCASGTRSAPTEKECRPNTPPLGEERTSQAMPRSLLRGI